MRATIDLLVYAVLMAGALEMLRWWLAAAFRLRDWPRSLPFTLALTLALIAANMVGLVSAGLRLYDPTLVAGVQDWIRPVLQAAIALVLVAHWRFRQDI